MKKQQQQQEKKKTEKYNKSREVLKGLKNCI